MTCKVMWQVHGQARVPHLGIWVHLNQIVHEEGRRKVDGRTKTARSVYISHDSLSSGIIERVPCLDPALAATIRSARMSVCM
jgi:hypothetical protein